MSTAKSRFNISLEKSTSAAVEARAKHEHVSVATAAVRLIEEALEMQEDSYLSAIADERLREAVKWVSHDEVWNAP